MPEVGEKAPDFTALDIDMSVKKLGDFLGKSNVVLAFFPFAFSPVCTKENCVLRDRLDDLMSYAAVIAVSVDSPYVLKAFAQANRFEHKLLSDVNREAVKAYNVLHESLGNVRSTVAKRSVFVVDKSGVIRYKWVTENPLVEPDYDEILKQLKSL